MTNGTKVWLTNQELANRLRAMAEGLNDGDTKTFLLASAGRLEGCNHPAYANTGWCAEMDCKNYVMKH